MAFIVSLLLTEVFLVKTVVLIAMRGCAYWLFLLSEPFWVLEVWEAFREECEGKKKQTRQGTLPCANHNLLDLCRGEVG